MKKILLAIVIAATVGSAVASDTTAMETKQAQTQESKSVSAASTDGNVQVITFEASNIPTDTTATVKNVPSVSGPPLTTSNDTCMGSSSGSLNIAGFGIGGGTTWTDPNCKMLKNSRELWNMGMKAASLARMCMDTENLDALEMTGFVCPQTTRAKQQQSTGLPTVSTPSVAQNSAGYTGSDPIIKARLGIK